MSVLAVIPARYTSTRFPGKPLVLIAGKPMIQHVYERVSCVPRIDSVLVATDDASAIPLKLPIPTSSKPWSLRAAMRSIFPARPSLSRAKFRRCPLPSGGISACTSFGVSF